jgi:hypothetical protein
VEISWGWKIITKVIKHVPLSDRFESSTMGRSIVIPYHNTPIHPLNMSHWFGPLRRSQKRENTVTGWKYSRNSRKRNWNAMASKSPFQDPLIPKPTPRADADWEEKENLPSGQAETTHVLP